MLALYFSPDRCSRLLDVMSEFPNLGDARVTKPDRINKGCSQFHLGTIDYDFLARERART
jgi:hypothetical protein